MIHTHFTIVFITVRYNFLFLLQCSLVSPVVVLADEGSVGVHFPQLDADAGLHRDGELLPSVRHWTRFRRRQGCGRCRRRPRTRTCTRATVALTVTVVAAATRAAVAVAVTVGVPGAVTVTIQRAVLGSGDFYFVYVLSVGILSTARRPAILESRGRDVSIDKSNSEMLQNEINTW